MTADIIAIPPRRPRGRPGKRLDDMRVVPFPQQPAALTQPGEAWHLNGFNMSQVIIIRDGSHQLAVAEFKTVRDAAAAVQCKAIVDKIIDARDGTEEFGEAVHRILQEYGR